MTSCYLCSAFAVLVEVGQSLMMQVALNGMEEAECMVTREYGFEDRY